MLLNDVLAILQQRGIRIGLEGDQLKVRAAKEAMTADMKQLLLDNKAALLEWARAKAREQQQNQPIPVRASGMASLPLSFSQQRLWFLEQLDPGSAAYHIPAAALLTGKLDLAVMNRVFAELITRHESLRTTFTTTPASTNTTSGDTSTDGDARQVVHATMPFAIACEDFAADSNSEGGKHAITQRVAQEARTPFDLRNGPLLRVRLLRLNPGSSDDAAQHLLLVTMHHIITDGWSINVMLGEIVRLYMAFSLQQPSPLPPLPIQYSDFACWQRATLTDEQLQQRLGYWQQKLAGVPVLELPTDFTRPAMRRGIGTQHEFDIDATTLAALKTIAQQRGVTLFIVLMAAYSALLHRYTGQSDICIGTPIAGRTRAELQNLIGFFVNTLALRCDTSGNPSVDELIARVNTVMQGATTHQDVPFESVVEALALTRDMSTTPVFQAMLVLQNASTSNRIDSQALGNLSIEALASDSGASKFDITFNLSEVANQLHVGIEYDTDLFGAPRIQRMGRHFANILRAFANDPATRIGDIDYLDASERMQILAQWNNTSTDYPKGVHLGAQFDAMVRANPNAIALDFDQTQISYGALDAQASQLAHHLRAHGMQDRDNIAICLQRSAELITGIVAIIKANGAYVPLDPEYPDDRLSFMLGDTHARLIVTTAQHAQRLRALPDTQLPPIVCIDADANAIARQPTHYTDSDHVSPRDNSDGEQLAYVMYTSGSTGMPKGVMVPQRGITRLVKNTNYIELGPDDATGHISNVSFDAATLEIWGALLNGGRIVGIDKETLLNRERFKTTLEQKRVSAMFITVTLFNLYVAEDPSMFASVKNLLVGGEALDPNKIRAVLAANPPTRLLNGYGPTENTTFTCCYHITQLASDAKTVPLGHPLANTTTYVVDQYNQLTPIGIAGELVTGGDGVALGYLNRDDLNAEKFVADPFATKAYAKLYRTGDIVRWRDDGTIEMLGRVDDQVKIRGFRIELGEIDAALGALPEVRECAVIVRNDDAGNKLLAAYVVPQAYVGPQQMGDHSAIINVIKQQLTATLPKFMLPHAYVVLDTLPLTSNGKLDRRALPAPDWAAQASNDYVAPRNDTEQQLAQLWQDVLGIERIGIHDSFFDLGGHSLLATRLVTRIEQQFGVQLPLRNLFENPTIAAISDAIATGQRSDLPPLTAQDRSTLAFLPLSAAQQRLWIIDQLTPGSPMYNIPFAARISGDLDIAAFERAIVEVINRHEALRTRFGVNASNEATQIIDPPQAWGLPQAWKLPQFAVDNDMALIEQRVFAFLSAPFDLQQGPLLRAQLLHINGSNEPVFLACMHHIIADGWSMDVLLHEISTLYVAFSHGQPSPLPALTVQYADVALWQQQVAAAGIYQRQLDYWKPRLTNVPVLQLPTDLLRPAITDARGRVIAFALEGTLLNQLQALSRQHNATLYMTLLAAFQLLLARYSGQTDIAVGSPIANRTHPLLEPLIGFFVNTIVLRSDIDLQQPFTQLLAQVRQTTLDAYLHQDLPFEKIVEAVNAPRDLSNTPLFQAMFALQTAAPSTGKVQQAQTGGGLVLKPIRDESASYDTAAKFDLFLSMVEQDGALQGTLTFRTSLWNEGSMQAFLRSFDTLLRSIVADTARATGELPLLKLAEMNALMATSGDSWNATQHALPDVNALHTLIEQQVLRTPNAAAVSYNGESWSYAELNRRANQLAQHLRQLGIGPGALVGVCIERGLNMSLALLAALKAGAAYVPFDPTFPADRLGFMLDDTDITVMLTASHLQHVLPTPPAHLLCLDRDGALWAQLPDNNPGADVKPDNLFNVIFTSGSTGKPKGVMVPQIGIINRLLWMQDMYPLNIGDRVLQKTPYSFDVSVWELFWPLLVGAEIVYAKPEGHKDPDYLCALIQRENIGTLHFVPSMLGIFLQNEHVSACASIKRVFCSGEALQLAHEKRFFEKLPHAELHNLYGPTEASVDVSYYPCSPDNIYRSVPIGKPVWNTQLHVLDTRLQPVPTGVTGELYIGGIQLAHGYLKRDELTRNTFIDNPFYGNSRNGSAHPSPKLYKTGDLARYLPDGNIEYLGRVDFQVKVRGLRIELGEIETVLMRHPAIKEALLVVTEIAAGNVIIVAYFVVNEGSSVPDVHTLRTFLHRDLPQYMIPNVFMRVDAIPLSANGKADRKALPVPDLSQLASAEYIEPSTATEQQLATIWREMLGVPRVGIDDNFFELGGHSLSAVKMISRAKEICHVEIALTQAFEYPSVRELSKYIDSIKWAQASAGTNVTNDATTEDREEFEL